MTIPLRTSQSLNYSICRVFIQFLAMSIGWAYFPSCTHDPFLAEDPTGIDTTSDWTGCDTTKIFFNRDILPVFRNSCAISGCHDTRTAEEGYVFTDYEKIIRKGVVSGKPANSEIYKLITTKKAKDIMPPSPYKALTANQIATINRWITEGLKNDSCVAVVSSCDTLTISYKNNIQPIFTAQCVSCHGPITNNSGIRLDSYAATKDAINTGRLLGSIRWENGFIRMPLDLPQLVGCDIKKFEIWIRKGAVDN